MVRLERVRKKELSKVMGGKRSSAKRGDRQWQGGTLPKKSQKKDSRNI